jgi:hypothetical protein
LFDENGDDNDSEKKTDYGETLKKQFARQRDHFGDFAGGGGADFPLPGFLQSDGSDL